ncbi:MAG: RAD55 family ATPase [Candidatus Nanohalobium sp.]
MSGSGVTVTEIQKQDNGSGKEVTISFQNQSEDLFYDFLSFYSGRENVDTELLDLKPGEVKKITVNVDELDEGFKISTDSMDSGVIYTEGEETEREIQEKKEEEEEQKAEEASEEVTEEEKNEFDRAMEGEKEIDHPEKKVGGAIPDLAETIQEMKEKTLDTEEDEEEEERPSLLDSILHPFTHPDERDQEIESGAEEAEGGEAEASQEDEEEELSITEKNDYQADRITTGVLNLDNKVEGGFVKGTMNLITGKTGTGKTAFCSNFIWKGAQEGEPGVYVTTEERQEDILEDINSMFGWDFNSLEEQDKVRVLSIKPVFPSKDMDNLSRVVRSYISDLLDQVNNAIEEIDADRVVIDSVSLVQMFIQDEYMSRVALSSLMNNLREAGVTAVLVGSIPETSEGLSKQGIIEYLVDTVILLEFVPVAEDYNRTLKIRKMRRTDHETDIFPLEVTAEGLRVYEAYESL